MKNSLRIPRIIHQTWKTKDVPSPLDQLPQTWKEYLPNWEYILWTDEMNGHGQRGKMQVCSSVRVLY